MTHITITRDVEIPVFRGFTVVATGRIPMPGEYYAAYNINSNTWSAMFQSSDGTGHNADKDTYVIFHKRMMRRVVFTETGETRTPNDGEWYSYDDQFYEADRFNVSGIARRIYTRTIEEF